MSRSRASLRTAGRALAVTAALLSVVAPAYPMSAAADTTAQAEAHERSVLAQVRVLQAQVAVAEQRYGAALQSVGSAVNAELASGADAQAQAVAAAQARQQLTQQVEVIYESGGSLGVDAGLLVDGDVSSLMARASAAGVVMHYATASVAAAANRADLAAVRSSSTERTAVAHIATERDVAAAAASVQSLLAREQTLLAGITTHVAALQAADRAAAAAAAAAAGALDAITAQRIAGLQILAPSPSYLALYKAAAPTCPGLSWTVLAAIGQVETGHGRDLSVSSAGAMGPMQFEPATFRAYAVDGDHDGIANIEDPADAIFSAAHYLCANGAGRGSLAGAIFHYNHAGWYVAMVMKLAGEYASWDG